MENSTSTIENLVEKIEQYTKTSIDVYKYTALYKAAALFSYLAVKFVLVIVAFVAALLYTVALALWFGELLGKTAYGFLIMGTFYMLLGVIVYIYRKPWIKIKVSNAIIESFETNESL